MGSPLSPVIANFFMEDFEERALQQATLKPLCWFRYMDDTFVIWPHGPINLEEFLERLYVLHRNIQFTMETEKEDHLPFLDIDIYRRPDDSLVHKVYQHEGNWFLYSVTTESGQLWSENDDVLNCNGVQ
ncbi:hypothetical protein Cfor_07414 [Coptotermes formosanus]|uniref:Reverse transcriptase domain-containing protein n=1 Tax=Coptotermes formosanus TaxID=36987 RepID=A0A6L2PZE8_COPFO|nr:hypothetical protein Cfor_07414 [Coptotermes formosanus]